MYIKNLTAHKSIRNFEFDFKILNKKIGKSLFIGPFS